MLPVTLGAEQVVPGFARRVVSDLATPQFERRELAPAVGRLTRLCPVRGSRRQRSVWDPCVARDGRSVPLPCPSGLRSARSTPEKVRLLDLVARSQPPPWLVQASVDAGHRRLSFQGKGLFRPALASRELVCVKL